MNWQMKYLFQGLKGCLSVRVWKEKFDCFVGISLAFLTKCDISICHSSDLLVIYSFTGLSYLLFDLWSMNHELSMIKDLWFIIYDVMYSYLQGAIPWQGIDFTILNFLFLWSNVYCLKLKACFIFVNVTFIKIFNVSFCKILTFPLYQLYFAIKSYTNVVNMKHLKVICI